MLYFWDRTRLSSKDIWADHDHGVTLRTSLGRMCSIVEDKHVSFSVQPTYHECFSFCQRASHIRNQALCSDWKWSLIAYLVAITVTLVSHVLTPASEWLDPYILSNILHRLLRLSFFLNGNLNHYGGQKSGACCHSHWSGGTSAFPSQEVRAAPFG